MRARLVAPTLAAALLVPAVHTVSAAPTPPGSVAAPAATSLHGAGRWLVDSQGRVVDVHGFNIVIKRPPYRPGKLGIGPDDARFLRRHGFTAVRLGVLMEALEPKPGRYDAGYLRAIVRTADMLARYGIRSLVDFHQDLYATTFKGEGLPTWMVRSGGVPNAPNIGFPYNYFVNQGLAATFDNFWANVAGPAGKPLQTWYAEAWQRVARSFRGDPAVLGYDIFNEPWPGTTWPLCFGPPGCPTSDTGLLVPFTNRIVHAIHRVDPGHLAFFEPWQSFSQGAATYVGGPGDNNTGMSFHVYCAAAAGLPEAPPIRTACNLVEHRTINDAIAQGTRHQEPLLLSEFGATSDVTELRAVVSYADAHSVPWLNWAYCACGDPTGSGRAEAVVYNPKHPPRGSNVNRPSLVAMDVPYALRTAGTPVSSSFDQSTATFRFTYSTESVVTGQRMSGTTVIYPSPLHYPHGYRVKLVGGRVMSRSSHRLVIRARRGASKVTVTVRR